MSDELCPVQFIEGVNEDGEIRKGGNILIDHLSICLGESCGTCGTLIVEFRGISWNFVEFRRICKSSA